jgi:cardiolipin synthase
MRHIPNILSVLRIIMVGVFAYLFAIGRPLAALSVYVLAFLTDILDGYLARRNNWITNLGKLLDPFADKLLIVVALICIYLGKRQSAFLVLFILSAVKELLMVLGGAVMLRRNIVVYADWFGKIATGMFGAGIILALLSFPFPQMSPWDFYVLTAATALSYLALIHYAVQGFFPGMRGKPQSPEDGQRDGEA